MRLWRIVGLATLAGVVAAGVVVERKRRMYRSYDTEELRIAASRPPRSSRPERFGDLTPAEPLGG